MINSCSLTYFDTSLSKGGIRMSKTADKKVKTSAPSDAVAECLEKLTALGEGNAKQISINTKQIGVNTESIGNLGKRLTAVEEFCKKCEGNPSNSTVHPQPQPTPQPQVASQPQPATQPVTQAVKSVGYNFPDGPRRMYLYWDHNTRTWRGPKADLFAAEQAGSDWKPTWVWIKGGKVDHFLTQEEIDKYCP